VIGRQPSFGESPVQRWPFVPPLAAMRYPRGERIFSPVNLEVHESDYGATTLEVEADTAAVPAALARRIAQRWVAVIRDLCDPAAPTVGGLRTAHPFAA
jgi:hypothetical protein